MQTEQDVKAKMLLSSFQFNQNWIIFADTKAGAILTINGVVMGFTISLGKMLKSLDGLLFFSFCTFYILYLIAAMLCVIMAILVIYPRPHKRSANIGRCLHMSGVAKNYGTDNERYVTDLCAASVDDLIKDYASLLHQDYLVATTKYRYVKKAIISFSLSIALAMILLVIKAFIY